jgi:hypothetical protein
MVVGQLLQRVGIVRLDPGALRPFMSVPGSFPDLGGRNRDIRFTPMSRHRQRDRLRQKSANNGLSIRTRATVRQPIVNLPALVAKQFAKAPFVIFGPSFEFVQERKHGVYGSKPEVE